MLFNSPLYMFLFLPVSLVGFWWLAQRLSHNVAAAWLCLCSLAFYAWWDIRHLPLLLASIGINYTLYTWIQHSRQDSSTRTAPVAIAIIINLALLGFFKYSDFLLDTINTLMDLQLPLAHRVLPLGISFFTFTQIAFLVDAHRRQVQGCRPLHYLLFVTYFPHLIAGPILHHREMLPQFAAARTYKPDAEMLASGLFLFAIGLAKKVLLADSLAPHAFAVFLMAEQGQTLNFVQAWQGALAYTLQLYLDFSGYIDMAVGTSRMFNITLPVNFNSPYKAVNIADFWRRWHMTLGRFFRNYVYIPLGGNREGLHRTQLNILVVMLLSGLWHGAGWTFILWGLAHALMSIVNNYWRTFRQRVLGHDLSQSTLPGRMFSTALTFVCVVFAWVIFRAENLRAAQIMLHAMLTPDLANIWHELADQRTAFAMIVPLLMGMWLLPASQQLFDRSQRWQWQPTLPWLAFTVFLLTAGTLPLLYSEDRISPFLYFNF